MLRLLVKMTETDLAGAAGISLSELFAMDACQPVPETAISAVERVLFEQGLDVGNPSGKWRLRR